MAEVGRPERPRRRTLSTRRLEAFSDGVLAIAITLLVLDITVRPRAGLAEVLREWPAYLAYVVSFLTIGAVWLAHTTLTEVLARTDAILLRLNLLLLLAVSVLPFPTRMVADSLSLAPTGNYRALWSIDNTRVFAKFLGYGPGVTFKPYISVEHLPFMGDRLPPAHGYEAYFDSFQYLAR